MKEKIPKKEKPPYNLWQNTWWMIGNAWRIRKTVLLLCVLMAAGEVGIRLVELFIAPAILQKVETAAPFSQLLAVILTFSLLLMGLSAFHNYISSNTMFGRIEIRLRILTDLNYKLDTTSFPNTEDPEILKKREKAMDALRGNSQAGEAIWETLGTLLKSLAGFVIYLSLLSSLHPLLLLVVMITTVAGYLVNKRCGQWGFRHREEEASYLHKIDYICFHSSDRALGKDIRLFGMLPWIQDLYSGIMKLYKDFLLRREKIRLLGDLADVALSFLRNGIAYFYLISLTLDTGLPASQFLLYFTAVTSFTSWIMDILSNFSTLHLQSLDLCSIREFLELPEPFRFQGGTPLKAEKGAAYEIQLKNLRFRYPGAEKDTLRNFNLTIHPGEKLAVVGLNGAGKTTLVKLICGLYDPTEGQVLLNGVDIRSYNRMDYYRLFSAVFQQFSILEAPLQENVAQTHDGLNLELVRECVQKAGLTQKVESLPKGYQTPVGRNVYEDGAELSGGETQRLMLARALYKNAPVIILDEPTAALDPIAENDIYMKYSRMTAGRTSVYISHRLASTQFCDRIILLEDGNIAEEGTHLSLMAQNGKYAQLFRIQSKYYREGSGKNDE